METIGVPTTDVLQMLPNNIMSIDHNTLSAAMDMLAPLYTQTLIELGYQDAVKINHNTHHPIVAITEVIWIVLISIIASPINPLMWGLYFVLAVLLGVLFSIFSILFFGIFIVAGALIILIGAIFLAVLSVVPFVVVLLLGLLSVLAPLYFLFIIGDVIFKIVFVFTPTWLFSIAAFLFWVSPVGLVTAALWLVVIFYISYSYNGWIEANDGE